jgi:hypothetical protein
VPIVFTPVAQKGHSGLIWGGTQVRAPLRFVLERPSACISPVYMKTQSLKTSVLLFLATTSFAVSASAVDFLDSAERHFYSPMQNQKFGIEVEMMGLSQEQVVQIVQDRYGGITGISDAKNTIRIANSILGNIEIKLEVNETSDDPNIKWDTSKNVIELVTEPITYEQTVELDKAMQELKKAGAIGTNGINPISIQINVGMMEGTPNQQALEVVDIMRNYYRKSHQEQIRASSLVPNERWLYLQDYSEHLMAKIFDPKYKPTAEQFFFDFIYRQSLEETLVHNKQAAWTMSEADVRALVEKSNYKVHVKITKLNQIKVASLLLKWFPNDPYTKAILKQGWIKAAPLLEYRIFNNDFEVAKKVRQVVGIHQATRKYGAFDHDALMAEKMHVSVKTIKKSRAAMMCEGEF